MPTRLTAHKNAIVSLVERGGAVRSFHVANINGAILWDVLRKNVYGDSHIMTDQSILYRDIGSTYPNTT